MAVLIAVITPSFGNLNCCSFVAELQLKLWTDVFYAIVYIIVDAGTFRVAGAGGRGRSRDCGTEAVGRDSKWGNVFLWLKQDDVNLGSKEAAKHHRPAQADRNTHGGGLDLWGERWSLQFVLKRFYLSHFLSLSHAYLSQQTSITPFQFLLQLPPKPLNKSTRTPFVVIPK